jgi:hypothetical protein
MGALSRFVDIENKTGAEPWRYGKVAQELPGRCTRQRVKHNGKQQLGRKKNGSERESGNESTHRVVSPRIGDKGEAVGILSSAQQHDRREKLKKAYSSRFGLLCLLLCVSI